MKIAVLSLTRDRLEYTKHCFAALSEYAGCGFDHHVLDQGSTDGTVEWLATQPLAELIQLPGNIGISRGMNLLLNTLNGDYDVVVKLDNDCELVQPDTLRDVCALTLEGQALLSPRILGLNRPPAQTGSFWVGGEEILDIPQIGGVFLAAPAWVYDEFRFVNDAPVWGQDDVDLCWWFRGRGGLCGYVSRLEAWHYQTTNGQHARFPDYFARTLAEGKVAL